MRDHTQPALDLYENRAQLDHDVEQLVSQLVRDLASRGVEYSAALASVRRVLKQM